MTTKTKTKPAPKPQTIKAWGIYGESQFPFSEGDLFGTLFIAVNNIRQNKFELFAISEDKEEVDKILRDAKAVNKKLKAKVVPCLITIQGRSRKAKR